MPGRVLDHPAQYARVGWAGMNLFQQLLDWLLRLLGFRRKTDFRGYFYFNPNNGRSWRYFMSLLNVKLGDTGTHTAVYAVSNLDGTPAEGVAIAYASDNDAACTVDAASGALTLVAAGVATITGTGTRGAFTHSDSGTVTIAQSDDFTGTLTLT
jgi:hypothetical protein